MNYWGYKYNVLKITVFWEVISPSLVGRYKRFGRTHYLQLQGRPLLPSRWRQNVSPKGWYMPTMHNAKTQKPVIITFTAVNIKYHI
jgi:hypothetical protein